MSPNANLFLINPNGILFGAGAQLSLQGSFIASTASSYVFANGSQFSTINPQLAPLLAVNVPDGLQFGLNSASLNVQNNINLQAGLGKTLALVGGEVNLGDNVTSLSASTTLYAPAGRIEVGSVSSGSLVKLDQIDKGFSLEYSGAHASGKGFQP